MHCTGASYNLLTNTGQGATENIPPSKWGNTSLSYEVDLSEDDNCNGRNKTCLVTRFCMGRSLTNIVIVDAKNNHSWLHNFAWGDLNRHFN